MVTLIENGSKFSFDVLREMTEGFSDRNFLVRTQFFQVFKGKYLEIEAEEDVTVKIWHDSINIEERIRRLKVETALLFYPNMTNCPNIVKFMGYCCEGDHVGAVYKLKSVATLEELIVQDDFQWRDRIIVALGIARLVEFLHYLEVHHSIHAATTHIILDQDMNPVLYDFELFTGGIIGCGVVAEISSVGGCACSSNQDKSKEVDGITSFGLLVLRLMLREDVIEDYKKFCSLQQFYFFVDPWLPPGKLRNQSFFYEYDYEQVARLAMSCIGTDVKHREMSKMVGQLESLLLFSLPVKTSCETVVVKGYTLVYFSFDDLFKFTDNFCKKNFLTKTQLGEAYRGKIQQDWKEIEAEDVVVKIWGTSKTRGIETDPECRKSSLEDNICRLRDEVLLLTHDWMIDHPNSVKLLGYCFDDKKVGAVYSIKPLDTLQNLFDNAPAITAAPPTPTTGDNRPTNADHRR